MTTHSFSSYALPELDQPTSLALPKPRRWTAGGTGWLTVQAGRVWLTRDGDPDDHVLAMTAGRLYERERAAVRAARASFPAAWKAASRRRLTEWMR